MSRESLAPNREHATTVADLARQLGDDHTAEVLGEVVAATADAIAEHFPQNIFADLDGLAGALARQAANAPDPPAHLATQRARLLALHQAFGAQGTIRFRYVHDFLYGFDWARWVARDRKARQEIGPFDPAFLDSMIRRGRELADLIERDDEKYPRLRGPGYRNPFGFSRDEASERALLAHLASHGAVPVQAWQITDTARFDRDYVELREAAAAKLGLAGRATG